MSLGLWDAAGRLLLALALSGAIGFEREAAHKTAGLRTHMLVGFGAALFTVLSVTAFESADPARVSAQIVAGVGFLGAGAIFRHGIAVRGLTTAAGMWAVAAIGMASGAGLTALATLSTGVAIVVLFAFRILSALARGRREEATVELDVKVRELGMVDGVCSQAADILAGSGSVHIQDLRAGEATVRIQVEPRRSDEVMTRLMELDGVIRTHRLRPE